jgi:hypothetical protein
MSRFVAEIFNEVRKLRQNLNREVFYRLDDLLAISRQCIHCLALGMRTD